MKTGLNTQLTQTLGITPKLTQSLKVLAMTQLELDQFIEEALVSNPLLEINYEGLENSSESESEKETPTSIIPDYDSNASYDYELRRDSSSGATEVIEATVEATTSLSEHLTNQLSLLPLTENDRNIAEAIVGSLNEDGFFQTNEDELAVQLGVNASDIRRVLEQHVQKLDPPGIGARSVLECFLLQLDGTEPLDKYARQLLCQSPTLLEEDDETISMELGLDISDVPRLRSRLRRLDPYPGHDIRSNEVLIRPDVVFRKTLDGNIETEVQDRFSKRITYSNPWKGTRWTNSEDKAFMQNAMQEAKWLISALNQRTTTLQKVAECLANHQKDYILNGPLGLKPLTLMEVAKEVEMHESTISRAIAGKYAQTPMGIMPLKSFFSAGLPTRSGELISIRRVQESIKALIACEPKHRPISDQAIAEHLTRQGIKIARRTVAKYREAMGILPTSKRKIRPTKIKRAA